MLARHRVAQVQFLSALGTVALAGLLAAMGVPAEIARGTVRLTVGRFTTDGEVVNEVVPYIGYLHRCGEKLGETIARLLTRVDAQRRWRHHAGAEAAAARVSRIPAGHPEGYLEGFATIYTEAAAAIVAHRNGKPVPADVIYPTVQDGVRGVAFVEACVASSRRNGAWVGI